MPTTRQLEVDAERAIARAILERAIAAGWDVTVNDDSHGHGEDVVKRSKDVEKCLAGMFSTDGDLLVLRKQVPVSYPFNKSSVLSKGWCMLIYGNSGWDVLSDYTVNLETLLEPIMALSDEWEAKINRR